MAEPEVVEDFYGVYLLYCINPKFKGRTYVGYTRDPNRRIMQHNRGTWAGGAHRTNAKGPWKMALVVHGFPNNISALRFEWAWQNPNKTTRLQHLQLRKIPRKESEFQFKLRILSEMLRVGPWHRLPLVIRWLEKEYFESFPPERRQPDHMPICHGPVKSANGKSKGLRPVGPQECLLCFQNVMESEKLKCTNSSCELISHITCLADRFLSPGDYVPIAGQCPFCDVTLKWGELVRRINKDDSRLSDVTEESDEDVQDKGFVDNDSWFLDCA